MMDDFEAAPLMACVPAIVTRPESYFIPPQAGKSSVAVGAAPSPNGGSMLCISIQHKDGELLIAAIPEQLLPQLTDALNDAAEQMRTRQYAQMGATQ